MGETDPKQFHGNKVLVKVQTKLAVDNTAFYKAKVNKYINIRAVISTL
jgi:hypothetical protein